MMAGDRQNLSNQMRGYENREPDRTILIPGFVMEMHALEIYWMQPVSRRWGLCLTHQHLYCQGFCSLRRQGDGV